MIRIYVKDRYMTCYIIVLFAPSYIISFLEVSLHSALFYVVLLMGCVLVAMGICTLMTYITHLLT